MTQIDLLYPIGGVYPYLHYFLEILPHPQGGRNIDVFNQGMSRNSVRLRS
jgi:hypothetical protein